MKLSYFPQIKLVHTSKIFHGQIYIPFANWLLMAGTIIVTAVYSNVSPKHRKSHQTVFVDSLADYPTGQCIWRLRYPRDVHHHVHGLHRCFDHLEDPPSHRRNWLYDIQLSGWPVPFLRTHKGSRRRMVHTRPRHRPLKHLHPLALRKGTAMESRTRRSFPTIPTRHPRRKRRTTPNPSLWRWRAHQHEGYLIPS